MKNLKTSLLSFFIVSLVAVLVFPAFSYAQGSIEILKQTIPVDNSQNFNFTSDIPGFEVFSITSNDGFLEDGLADGIYTVTESIITGYTLTGINCNSENVTTNVDNRTVIIDLMNEDIVCTFINVANGEIIIQKNTVPAGGLGFNFSENITEPNGDFMLDGGGNITFLDVSPGEYEVTEDDPTVNPGGFFLSDLVCDDMGSSTNVGTRTATIDLDSEEVITCTFTNTAQLEGLIMTKTDFPDPVAAGTELTYDIDIVNNSNFVATNVMFVDTLPDGLIPVDISSNIPGVNCQFDVVNPLDPQTASCEIIDMAPTQEVGISIVVIPDTSVFNTNPVMIENTALLTAQPGNVMREATTQTLVNPMVDIEIDSGNENRRVNEGNRFTIAYDITVNPDNQEVLASLSSDDAQIRADALDVMLDVGFPGVFNIDTVETTQGSCIIGIDPVIQCDFGDIMEGQTVTVTIVFIAPNESGDFTIGATVRTLGQNFSNFVFVFVRDGGSDCSLAAAGSTGTSNLLYLFIPLFIFARRYWDRIKKHEG